MLSVRIAVRCPLLLCRALAPQAMWLWDSCFHAIGRQIVEPELAWEFLHAMLVNAAPDGHVPIQAEPWNGQKSGDTQPPLLALGQSCKPERACACLVKANANRVEGLASI